MLNIRQRRNLLSWSFPLVALACTGEARSGVVFSQTDPESPTAAFSSQDLPSGPIVSDNFSLEGTGSVTIRSVRFIGGCCISNSDSQGDNFRIVFHEDSTGLPGAVINGGDFDIGDAFVRTPTGGPILNGRREPQDYGINLADGITLNTNTPYWITIMNNIAPESGWVWARSTGGFDNSIAGTITDFSNPSWQLAPNGGMWFELSDQVVPEPHSVAVILFSLLMATIQRRTI